MPRTGVALALVAALGCSATVTAQSADLAARSRAAGQAMEAGRFADAARIYQNLVQAVPNDPGLLMNLGMALAMGGQEADAIAPLQKAVALNPKLVPAHMFLGSSYLARGDAASAVAPLERVVAARPSDVESRRLLAQAYSGVGRTADAVSQLRKITELAPALPAAWHALGHAYNALAQEAMSTFDDQTDGEPWRDLLLADALFADGRLTDAFAIYRSTLEKLPSMVSIHDSIARIYEQSGHADWSQVERRRGVVPAAGCAKRKALCHFRAGRYRAALVEGLAGADTESRYWRVRAATELALAAYKRLDALPDSRERREVRATLARGDRRYLDAITELQHALKFSPGDPGLLDDLATSYYFAKNYEQAVATLAPLLKANPDDARLLTVYGDSLLQLQRIDDALPVLRRAVEVSPSYAMGRLTLGRAYAQKGDHAAAIPLIESQLSQDHDGSLHVQLARSYTAVGQKDKAAPLLERSQEIQRAAQERSAAVGQRTITPPK
jgi:predicted Zn-dependent protease